MQRAGARESWGVHAGAERGRKTMTRRKPGRFSATKAVKANARERVGQPKPSRVVQEQPRTGRQTKHKPKIEELLRGDE